MAKKAFTSLSEALNADLAALNSRPTLFEPIALKDNAEDINREEGQMEALQHGRIERIDEGIADRQTAQEVGNRRDHVKQDGGAVADRLTVG